MSSKLVILTAILLFSIATLAQANYEKGHYTTVGGVKTTGFILNEEWDKPPTSISFKKDQNNTSTTIVSSVMNGFKIDGVVEYVKSRVNMDMSSNRTSNLSNVKNPEWERRTLMLKVLSDSDAKLYYYENDGFVRYFISKDSDNLEIEQLVYKRFIDKDGALGIATNNYFQQQLVNAFSDCQEIKISDLTDVQYAAKSLTRIFERYAECSGAEIKSYEQEVIPTFYTFRAKIGYGSAAYKLEGAAIASLNVDFGRSGGLRFELEGEVKPLKDKNAGFFLGIVKDSEFESMLSIPLSTTGEQEVSLVYNAIEIPIGARYYIPLGEGASFAIHGGYNFNFPSKGELRYERSVNLNTDETAISGNFILGAGVHINRFFVEARLGVGRKIFSFNDTNTSTFSVVAGYDIFN